MSVYQKYLKYKNKYIKLKQIGGANYDSNICIKTILKSNLNVGDTIKFTSVDKQINFNVNAGLEDNELKLVSIEKIRGTNDSVLVITIWKDNTTCKLNFIRGGHDILTFSVLRTFFSCIAAYFGCELMILEDDSFFTINDVFLRALIYRISIGRESIYSGDNFGFNMATIESNERDAFKASDLPYNLDKYNIDKTLIIESKLKTFKELLTFSKNEHTAVYVSKRMSNPIVVKPYIITETEEIITLINNFIELNSDTVLFSNYIRRVDNVGVPLYERNKIKKLIDILITNPYSITPEYVTYYNSLQIYGAIRRIFIAHQHMESRKVECTLCARAVE